MRAGGALVVVDNDDDPYNSVREWWNTAPNGYATPRQHLFAQLRIAADASGLFHVGKGVVLAERVSPAALTYEADGGETLRGFARQAAAAIHLPWSETNALVLRRGPYVIAAGLDDSIPNAGRSRCIGASSISSTQIFPYCTASRSRPERAICSST